MVVSAHSQDFDCASALISGAVSREFEQAFSNSVFMRLQSASPCVLFSQSAKSPLWPPTMNITVRAVIMITVAAMIISIVLSKSCLSPLLFL